MVLPAAVLFATVFSIGAFTRHAEITAAKASGISFYRIIMPIFLGAVLAVRPGPRRSANGRRSRTRDAASCCNEDKSGTGGVAIQFRLRRRVRPRVQGRRAAHGSGRMQRLQIERKGAGPDYPTYVLIADSAMYEPNERSDWVLAKGAMNVDPRHRIDVHDVVRRGVRQAIRPSGRSR